MKTQLSEKEMKLYENGLKNTEILRPFAFQAKMIFMMAINLSLSLFTLTDHILIPIGIAWIVSIVFYIFDLPLQLNLVYSMNTIVMYVLVEILCYFLNICKDIPYMMLIAICTNVYFCATSSNKVDMTSKYCKEMLRK